ncbi:MAG: type II secretion system protein GspJ, partial [Planctomycetaceae bacterium]
LLSEDLQSVVVPGQPTTQHTGQANAWPGSPPSATRPAFPLTSHSTISTDTHRQQLTLQPPDSVAADHNDRTSFGIPPGEVTQAADLPVFFLRGTHQTLTLSVCQPTSESHPIWPGALLDSDTQSTGHAWGPAAPGLTQIRYSFQAPYVPILNDRRPPAGLLRQQHPWIVSGSERSTQSPMAVHANLTHPSDVWPTSDLKAKRPASPNANTQHLEKHAAQHVLVPEVVGCRFRYFDGRAWLPAWDSQQRHSLPRAVEVELWLLTRKEIEQHFGIGLEQPQDKHRITGLPPESRVSNQAQPIPARHYRRILLLGPGIVTERTNTTVLHSRTSEFPPGTDDRRGPS